MISFFIQWAQHMNKQRFVLISSLLAIALKQMIFAVLLGIQWFEKQNVMRWKFKPLPYRAYSIFYFLFLVNGNLYGSAWLKNKMGRNNPKASTETGKISAWSFSSGRPALRADIAFPHGEFSNSSVLLHLVSLFLLLASTFSGDFVLNFRGRFLPLQP